MNRKILASAMLALSLGLTIPALAGCSGGDSDSSTSVEDNVAVPPAQALPEAGADSQKLQGGAADGTGSLPGAAGEARTVQRAVITTISTTVEVPDVPGATARVIAATAAAKGYVQAQYSTADTGKRATTTMTVRIPSALADQFLATVAGLGTVTSTERSSDDVTAEVADVDARLANAKAGVVRLRALLSQAKKVSDIVAIESALSERQAEAESLAAQQRALADLTSLATITVVVTPAPDSPPTGFFGGLTQGWKAFQSAIANVARAAGYLVPFAILAILLIGLVLIVVRSSTRGRNSSQNPAQTHPAQAHPAQTHPAQGYPPSPSFPDAQASVPTSAPVPPATSGGPGSSGPGPSVGG